jgi:hypothetical protein
LFPSRGPQTHSNMCSIITILYLFFLVWGGGGGRLYRLIDNRAIKQHPFAAALLEVTTKKHLQPSKHLFLFISSAALSLQLRFTRCPLDDHQARKKACGGRASMV